MSTAVAAPPDSYITSLRADEIFIDHEYQRTLDVKHLAEAESGGLMAHRVSARPGRLAASQAPIPIDNSDPSWRWKALCAETTPHVFFGRGGGSSAAAKRICRRCDVQEECLQFALDNRERYGVWGGKSECERRKLLRQMENVA